MSNSAVSFPSLPWSSSTSLSALNDGELTPDKLEQFLHQLTQTVNHTIDSPEFPAAIDAIDPIAIEYRTQFSIPKARSIATAIAHGKSELIPDTTTDTNDSIYLCGNSLGLLPRTAASYVQDELTKWSLLGVEGHFAGARPWVSIDEEPTKLSIPVVGAKCAEEIAIMNSLSVNLHLLLTSFYRPTAERFKILMEADAFCSDHHIIRSQVALHGRVPEDAILTLSPRQGETTLRTDDIVDAIKSLGSSLALVLLPGIQFYTGQFFDISTITAAGHSVGAYVGWDLAHAVGNVPLQLHAWNVDFACWCSYKYLNSGPGSIAGAFLHERHFHTEFLKLRGWWGQLPDQRFQMKSVHVEKPGAQSYMLSNPPVLPTVCMQASLEVHNAAGQQRMRMKSFALTGYLEYLLKTVVGVTTGATPLSESHPSTANFTPSSPSAPITVRLLTPTTPSARGCQLSLLFSVHVKPIHFHLSLHGIVTDVRQPNVIRVSPTPLYNTFNDVYQFVQQLKKTLQTVHQQQQQQSD